MNWFPGDLLQWWIQGGGGGAVLIYLPWRSFSLQSFLLFLLKIRGGPGPSPRSATVLHNVCSTTKASFNRSGQSKVGLLPVVTRVCCSYLQWSLLKDASQLLTVYRCLSASMLLKCCNCNFIVYNISYFNEK